MGPRADDNKWVTIDFPSQYRIGLKRAAELAEWEVKTRDGVTRVCSSERWTGTIATSCS